MNAYSFAGNPSSSKRAVLIHSLAMDRNFWRPVAGPYTVEGFADDLAQLPDAPRQWEERAQKALQGGMQSLVEFQVTRWFSEAFRASHPDGVAQCVATFVKNELQAYAATCRMLGAAARELHQGIRGSTLTVLKNARHLTPLEKPQEIASQLQRLFQPAPVV